MIFDDKSRLDYFYGDEVQQCCFLAVPEFLMENDFYRHTLKADGILLYSIMFRRTKLSRKNGWIDERNRVYIRMSLKEVEHYADCKVDKAREILDRMENKAGLIERIKDTSGKTERIYLKNYIPPQRKGLPEEQNTNNSMGKTEDEKFNPDNEITFSGAEKPTQVDRKNPPVWVGKSDRSYIKINKTEIDNIHIHPSSETGFKVIKPDKDDVNDVNEDHRAYGYDSMEEIKAYVDEQIQYHDMLPTMNASNRAIFEDMYKVICSVICGSTGEPFNIDRCSIPYNVVKSVFMELKYEHLEYALICMDRTRSSITNKRNYLVSVLYNSYLTMNTGVQQDLKASGVI